MTAGCSILLSLILAGTAVGQESVVRMDQVVRSLTDDGKFMGAVLVAREDKILFSKAYGSANLEWTIPNATNTKFRLGSLTKQFTAASVLLLEERGKLRISDPVKTYYPEAPAAWDNITLLHLLTHTSGIPNFTDFPDYQPTRGLPTTPTALVMRFRARPLDFAPGKQMRYSNSGYEVLGLVIEKVSGTSYQKFIEDNLFRPLGMNDSGYDSNSAIVARRAAGYIPGPTGPANAPYIDMSIPYAAGGLYSTTEDLLRWESNLFGGRVLSAASLKKMTTPAMNDYAMGLQVVMASGHRLIQHGGGIEGFNTRLAYYPDEKLTIVALSNINGPGADSVVEKLGALAHGEVVTLPSEHVEIQVRVDILKQYIGTYELRPGFDMVVTVAASRLTVTPTGQAPDTLFAESEDRFFSRRVDAQIEFGRDSNGAVTGLVLHQGTFHGKAPRKH